MPERVRKKNKEREKFKRPGAETRENRRISTRRLHPAARLLESTKRRAKRKRKKKKKPRKIRRGLGSAALYSRIVHKSYNTPPPPPPLSSTKRKENHADFGRALFLYFVTHTHTHTLLSSSSTFRERGEQKPACCFDLLFFPLSLSLSENARDYDCRNYHGALFRVISQEYTKNKRASVLKVYVKRKVDDVARFRNDAMDKGQSTIHKSHHETHYESTSNEKSRYGK